MRDASIATPYRRRETVAAATGAAGHAAGAKTVTEPVVADDSASTASNLSPMNLAAPATAVIPTLRDVMTPTPTCVAPEASVLQLVRLLHAKRFRHLLVTTDGGKLVGIISDRDVVRCFGPTDYPDEDLLAGIRTDEIMSRDVISISSDRSLAAALDVMHDHGVSCLPIVDGERLVGIVTTSDLMRLLRQLVAR
jgi:acetoin utilization protein AcuB